MGVFFESFSNDGIIMISSWLMTVNDVNGCGQANIAIDTIDYHLGMGAISIPCIVEKNNLSREKGR